MSNVKAVMDLPDVIGEMVRRHGSINAAARACGMAEPTLWMIYTGKRKRPTLNTLRMIAHGYGVSLSELIDIIERGNGSHYEDD